MSISLRTRLAVIVGCTLLTTIGVASLAVVVERDSFQRRVDSERERVVRVVSAVPNRSGRGGFRRAGALAGVLQKDGQRELGAVLPPMLHDLVVNAIPEALLANGEMVLREVDQGDTVMIFALLAMPNERVAWSGVQIERSALSGWAVPFIAGLTLAVAGLVLVAVHTVIRTRRDAESLRTALQGLAIQLETPVPKPEVRELQGVGDGIRELATALQRAHEREHALQQELAAKERLAALGRVSAGLAHEVRNPLAAIKLRADLARRVPNTPTGVVEDLREIAGEVSRLDRLVSDLLVLARRKTGPMRTVALEDIVSTRVRMMEPWVHAQDRAVEWEESTTVMVHADEDGLARVVDNLVRNAVQAAPAGSTVRIRQRATETSAVLEVQDTGDGVPVDRVGELFEPFFTLREEGTGLGLALSRAIVEAHNGTLTYQRDHKTTTFAVTLPRAKES